MLYKILTSLTTKLSTLTTKLATLTTKQLTICLVFLYQTDNFRDRVWMVRFSALHFLDLGPVVRAESSPLPYRIVLWQEDVYLDCSNNPETTQTTIHSSESRRSCCTVTVLSSCLKRYT